MKKSITLLRIASTLPIFASAFLLSGCGTVAPPSYKVNLEIWGSLDDSDSYQPIMNDYQQKYAKSHVGSVIYRKVTAETYRADLLSAFAEGNGPDAFLIRSSWLPLFKNLIAPAPAYEISEREFRDAFVDVAANDLVSDGKIYGIPMSVDSLALYYNKDLFNAAGIASPPSTWDDVAADAKLLDSIDNSGNIRQSAIALGTAKNINRSTDVLLALATQYGMTPAANGFSDEVNLSSPPAWKALAYYSGFAKLGSSQYSWNANQHYSVDAFYEGNLAMMVNYSWQIDAIKKKNAKLNFGVAPLPQIAGAAPSNYANYWVLVVAKHKNEPDTGGKKSALSTDTYDGIRTHETWQFLHYLAFPHPGNKITLRNALATTSVSEVSIADDPTKIFLEKSRQPAARRDLIEAQKADAWLAPFAAGNLIAKDWRVGDTEAMEGILADAIESVNRGEATVEQALSLAMNQIAPLQRKATGN
ncbi:MAG: extracellular solute-binding protein [Candidatus Moraniibacteriota bacterium]